jgi:ABC-type bacteriocin/lantibiotic exporter with double-glycine peptidase domain
MIDCRILPTSDNTQSRREGVGGIALNDLSEDQVSDRDIGSPCATLRNVSGGWSREEGPVLKHLDVSLTAGDITMIDGPVGCGKSTLLKLLLCEVREISGVIHSVPKRSLL